MGFYLTVKKMFITVRDSEFGLPIYKMYDSVRYMWLPQILYKDSMTYHSYE